MIEDLSTAASVLMVNVWKLLGVAGLVGFAATGVALARHRRWRHYDAEELREQLDRRLAETEQR